MVGCPYFMILNMILLIILFLLSLIMPLFHLKFLALSKLSSHYFQEMMLKYSLFFNIGCVFTLGFAGHFLYGNEIAHCLSWNWSPFQYELSFSELALALLGLCSSLFGYQFWLATIICSSIWLLGASTVHIYYDLVSDQNIVANGAFVAYWNIFIVVWIIAQYILYNNQNKRDLNFIAKKL